VINFWWARVEKREKGIQTKKRKKKQPDHVKEFPKKNGGAKRSLKREETATISSKRGVPRAVGLANGPKKRAEAKEKTEK